MITARSRYSASAVEKVPVGEDIRQTIVYPNTHAWTTNFTYYLWRVDDRPDLLADAFFGDPTLWWTVARANPEILDWQDLPPGTVIRIPSA